MLVISIFSITHLLTTSKNGQDILRTLIVLKRRIVDRQTEWAIADAYPESPALGTFPAFSRTSAGITPRVRDVFREKTDYRIEFEQLLGGKVEDTRPRNIFSSSIPSSSIRQSPEKGTQNDEDGPNTEGIEFRRPTRSESPLPR
jgi:hypothetical protein